MVGVDNKMVLKEWLDSKGVTSQRECLYGLEPSEPGRCVSVGFPAKETAEYKTIARSRSQTPIDGQDCQPLSRDSENS